MKILIFGGTGAMGTPLANLLAEQGHEVYVTSRRQRENRGRLHYIQGDAHDMTFVREVLQDDYDVLVDFMNYRLEELQERVEMILDAVGQYIFISTCRVYMPSNEPITEQTPRLLDACQDAEFLATNEYALAKAREENVLYAGGKKNWTIVRPALTYNAHRLQLGCYEMEHWLYRVLNGRPMVFFDDLIDLKTPMTYGGDVAKGISLLAGNPEALGETVQIATPETMTWREIIQLYFDTIKQAGGVQPQVIMLPHAETTESILGRKWRLKYNRSHDREFASAKMDRLSEGRMTYTPMREGLESCLRSFLEGNRQFRHLSAKSEAYMDRLTKSHTPLSAFSSLKDKMKYCVGKYTPYFALMQRQIR